MSPIWPWFNKTHIFFGIVNPQDTRNHCNKAVLRCFLLPSECLGELLLVYDLLYLCSDENTCVVFCFRQFRKEVLKLLECYQLLIKWCDHFFRRPNYREVLKTIFSGGPTVNPVCAVDSARRSQSPQVAGILRCTCCSQRQDSTNSL